MADILKKFGRYFLLDQIAQGGMAEIYRARMASLDGAGRLMVIKRIQAGFGSNNEFLKMFKDEIKVTMGFNHPNIVQVYDFGEEQEQPFIAMELVDGKNLRQFISRFAELRQPFPVELAVYVVEQAASGLQYAHSYKDKISGESLDIVHRDISPQNILISFDGNVKVIDFGIAKASTNIESTRAGVIKGKPSYLSPEQISGEILDGRSDIFSLGAVLWETLTGKKLFAGDNDLAVLKLIESCQTHVKPPSTINPKVPKELDYIVLKSLAKQREKRYQTSEEFQRALHKFLYGFSNDFNPADLGYYAKDLFKGEIVDDRKKVQRLNDEVERLLRGSELAVPGQTSFAEAGGLEPDRMDRGGAEPAPEKSASTQVDRRPRQSAKELVLKSNDKVEVERGAHGRATPRPRSTGPAIRPATGNQGNTISAHRVNRDGQRTRTGLRKAPAAVYDRPRSGVFKALGIGVAALMGLIFFAPQLGFDIPYVTPMIQSFLGNDTILVLDGNETNISIFINGRPVQGNRLPARFASPVGVPLRIRVTGANGVYEDEVTLFKGERKTLSVLLRGGRSVAGTTSPEGTPLSGQTPSTPVTAGNPGGSGGLTAVGPKVIQLRLNITPGGGRFTSLTVNGRAVSPENPVVLVQLDTPLEIIAERPGYRLLKRETVLESKQFQGLREWQMDVPMEPVQYGFLTIRTTPTADATILLDGKPWVKKTPFEHERIPIGSYRIKLTNEVLGMEKIVQINVQENRIVDIDEKLDIKD